jgi:hypothetical protein
MDSHYLNAIHCFVRRQLEYFVATKEDASAPSPGRKVKAVVGQVGIRCIHCAQLNSKDRVKRSVCYPPSIGGIYHAVSNMKCDHFAVCKGLPQKDREEYLRLRASNMRKRSKQAKGVPDSGIANATAQYYHDCALRLGLHDTEKGIRFKTDTFIDTATGVHASANDTAAHVPSSDGKSANSVASVQGSADDAEVHAPSSDGISALVIAASDLVSMNEKASTFV